MAYMKGLVATLAELEDFYKGQPAGDILELMKLRACWRPAWSWMSRNWNCTATRRARSA